MKTISQDGSYIDYTGVKWGVRVRRDSCRPIALDAGVWTEHDTEHQLPVPAREIELPVNHVEWMSALAVHILDYEKYRTAELNEDKAELRQLVIGSITFDSARAS